MSRSSTIRQATLCVLVLVATPCSARPQTKAPSEENELKLVLTEDGYHALLHHFQKKGSAAPVDQKNYYFDIQAGDAKDFLVKRNGINIRVRRRGKAALLTVKVGDPDPSLLPKTGLQLADALRTRAEYECVNDQGAFAMAEITSGKVSLFAACRRWPKTPKSSEHPVSVLEKAFTGGFVTTAGEKIFPEKKNLVCVATNRTTRSAIATTLGGTDVVIELDKTLFPRDYLGFNFDVEVEKVGAEAAVEAELKGLFSILAIPYKPSQAGKTRITFLIVGKNISALEDLLSYGSIVPAKKTEKNR